jgi:hypothetical protein
MWGPVPLFSHSLGDSRQISQCTVLPSPGIPRWPPKDGSNMEASNALHFLVLCRRNLLLHGGGGGDSEDKFSLSTRGILRPSIGNEQIYSKACRHSFYRDRICRPFKEPRRRFLAWRTCAGIFKQSMGARNRVGIGLSYRHARLHSLAELVPCNRFLGSFKV